MQSNYEVRLPLMRQQYLTELIRCLHILRNADKQNVKDFSRSTVFFLLIVNA